MKSKRMKIWIAVLVLALIACAAAMYIISRSGHEATMVVIRVDGEVYDKIDLDTVAVAYDMEIKTKFGYNKIRIEPDGVSVIAADCPDKLCMEQGKVSKTGVPIVCLPHRLTIELEGGGSDA